jgi:hypothetical protein
MADYAKWSPSHSGRSGAPVIWLAIHTAEGTTTAESLANYLANPNSKVSYHDVCDDSTTIQCVDYDEGAWVMLGGNSRSDQICCTGFAAWSRDTWLSHEGMLDRIARWLAERARLRGIPLEHIGPAGVAKCAPGVIGHGDYTIGAAMAPTLTQGRTSPGTTSSTRRGRYRDRPDRRGAPLPQRRRLVHRTRTPLMADLLAWHRTRDHWHRRAAQGGVVRKGAVVRKGTVCGGHGDGGCPLSG